jgi:hypothetical protein
LVTQRSEQTLQQSVRLRGIERLNQIQQALGLKELSIGNPRLRESIRVSQDHVAVAEIQAGLTVCHAFRDAQWGIEQTRRNGYIAVDFEEFPPSSLPAVEQRARVAGNAQLKGLCAGKEGTHDGRGKTTLLVEFHEFSVHPLDKMSLADAIDVSPHQITQSPSQP